MVRVRRGLMGRPVRAPGAGNGILSAEYAGATIGIIALASLQAFEALAVGTAMPTISGELDGRALYALAFAGPLAAAVSGMVVMGTWADRAGPRVPTLAAVATFLAGLVLAGLAPTMSLLLVGRFVHGFAGGGVAVTLYVLVARTFPATMHARVFGALAAAWVVPALFGPLVAGLVTAWFGWRWVFLGAAALLMPVLVTLAPALRRGQSEAARASPTDNLPGWRPRRMVAAFAVTGAVLVLHLGTQEGAGLPPVTSALAVALALTVLWPAVRTLLPAGTFRLGRGLPAVFLLMGVVTAAYVAAEVYLPLLLSERYGLGPSLAGLVLTAGALGWAMGSWLQGRLDQRTDEGAPAHDVPFMRVGLVLLGAGIGSVLFAATIELPWWTVVVGWAVGGAGMGVVYPRFAVLTMRLSDEDGYGLNSSSLTVMENLGMALVLAAVGALFGGSSRTGGVAPFAIALVLALVLVCAALLMIGRVRPQRT